MVGAVVDEELVTHMEFASMYGIIIENMKLLNGLRYNMDSTVFELSYGGVRGR